VIARLTAGAFVALLIAFGVQTWRVDMAQEALEEHERIAARELMDAERRARAQEQEWADNARKAAQTYATQTARIRADAGGARDELERLRDTLSSGDIHAAEGAASAARADDLARTRIVAEQCANALVQVARAADDAEARLIALQRYVAGLTQE
jgi:hypothetical protein